MLKKVDDIKKRSGNTMKTFRQLKEYDTYDLGALESQFMADVVPDTFNTLPVFDTAVIKRTHHVDGKRMVHYYLCNAKDDIVESYWYFPDRYEFVPTYRVKFKAREANGDFFDILWRIPDEYADHKLTDEDVVHDLKVNMSVEMAYISYTLTHQETHYRYAELPKSQIVHLDKTKPVAPSGNAKRKVVMVNGYHTIYAYTSQDFSDRVRRSYERHTDSWSRNGHWRHYKSGKKVWINSTTCGKGKLAPKTYNLGGERYE